MRLDRTLTALWMAVCAALAGCETAAPYAACPLDKEVTDKGVCTGTAGSTSCVVRKHPQCDLDVCLAYYGTTPVCTQPCTSDSECPTENGVAAKCWTFAPGDSATGKAAERYCVPPSRLTLVK